MTMRMACGVCLSDFDLSETLTRDSVSLAMAFAVPSEVAYRWSPDNTLEGFVQSSGPSMR